MKKTKITFEEIKAGDMILTEYTAHGVKSTAMGIAFEQYKTRSGFTEWRTAQGGTITDDMVDEDAIYRVEIDVTEGNG